MHHADHTPRLVRPRVLWGGLALAIGGAVVLGAGIIVLSTLVSLIGGGVLIIGAGLAWWGGVRYDNRGSASPAEEGEEVIEGDQHPGVSPAARIDDGPLRENAAAQERRTQQLLARGPAHAPPLAPAGAALLVVAALCLLVSIIRLYPTELRTPTVVDGMAATGWTLAAIRVSSVRSPTPITAVLAAALGALLVVLGLTSTGVELVRMLRLVIGGLAVAGAVICLVSPRRTRQ